MESRFFIPVFRVSENAYIRLRMSALPRVQSRRSYVYSAYEADL